MELIERVLLSLRERREKILKGEVNCIPSPFNRFRSEFAGIEQGRYYLVSGITINLNILNFNLCYRLKNNIFA